MATKKPKLPKPLNPSPRDEEERQLGAEFACSSNRLVKDTDVIVKVVRLRFRPPFMNSNEISEFLEAEHPDINSRAVTTIITDALRDGLVTAHINSDHAYDLENQLKIRVCKLWLQYPHASSREISEEIGVTGSHLSCDDVMDIVRDALKSDLVTVQINFPLQLVDRLSLETELVRTFPGLRVAKVTDAPPSILDEFYGEDAAIRRRRARRDVILRLAPVVANIMEQFLMRRVLNNPDDQTIVGVGWGVNLFWVLRYLTATPRPWIGPRLDFVPFIGLTARPQELGLDAYNLATRLAEIYGGRSWSLSVPALLQRFHASQAKQFTDVRRALKMLTDARLVINSVAPVKNGGAGDRKLSYDPDVNTALRRSHRWQDVCGRIGLGFFDEGGNAIPLTYHRALGIDLEALCRIATDPECCALTVTGGNPARIPALLGALRGYYISHLLTDEHTARALLVAQAAQNPLVA